MKDNRADSTAVIFHLPLLAGWVAVVTFYPETSLWALVRINLQGVLYFLFF